ncbi:DUF6498-containing protein [Natronomonas amylolytica]|uniref:DUF6498-containing protein n=1 Tax=Natronomonas amylolytica TaxID=3108498 RepID=UPI00300801E2
MNPTGRRPELLAALLTNAAPLVGVAFFGWSLAAILLVYWFELGVMLVLAAVRALFAQLPPQHPSDGLVVGATRHKRGGLSVPWTATEIQVAHLPVLVVAVPAFGAVWFVAGGVGFAGLDAAGVAFSEENAAAGLAIIGAAVGRSIETLYGYFLVGRHHEVNAQLALRTAVWPILVVGMVLFFGGAGVAAGVPPVALLGGVVCVKLLLDLASVYRDRLEAFDERTYISFGWATDTPAWPAIDEELSEPVEVVRPRPAGVLLGGVGRGLRSPAVALSGIVGLLAVLLTLASGDLTLLWIFGGVALVVLVVLAAVGVLDRAIRYLTMEYRVGDDLAVLGYDRLLREPQWRVPTWKVEAADARETVADRLLGTETLVVSHDNRTIRIPAVPDAEALRSTDETN